VDNPTAITSNRRRPHPQKNDAFLEPGGCPRSHQPCDLKHTHLDCHSEDRPGHHLASDRPINLAEGHQQLLRGSAALVYGAIGALVALLALAFSFGPLGHADRYLPASQPEHADTP
jgi:hypothetical protein